MQKRVPERLMMTKDLVFDRMRELEVVLELNF
jgi:hypothetical protein